MGKLVFVLSAFVSAVSFGEFEEANQAKKVQTEFQISLTSLGETEKSLQALNNFLNLTKKYRFDLKISPDSIKDGSVTVDLNDFFSEKNLAYFGKVDPTSECTGKVRLNKLLYESGLGKNYSQLISAPSDRDGLLKMFNVAGKDGVSLTEAAGRVVLKDPFGGSKYLHIYKSGAGLCFRMDVYLPDAARRPEGVRKEDEKLKAADLQQWMCSTTDGMWHQYIFNADGKLQHDFPAIPGLEPEMPYSLMLNNWLDSLDPKQAEVVEVDSPAFLSKEKWGEIYGKVRENFDKKMEQIGASPWGPNELMGAGFKFTSPVTPEQAAIELNTTPGMAKMLIGEEMKRPEFEKKFCEYHKMLHEGETTSGGTHSEKAPGRTEKSKE